MRFFQSTVASKFLTLTESVRDAADLYLSLKHPPIVFINDTPCGFVHHVESREPLRNFGAQQQDVLNDHP